MQEVQDRPSGHTLKHEPYPPPTSQSGLFASGAQGQDQCLHTAVNTDIDYQHTERDIATSDRPDDGNCYDACCCCTSVMEVKEGCSECSSVQNVKNFDDIKPGDHITMKGEKFAKRYPFGTKFFYTHHAIVDEVKHTTEDKMGAIVKIYHVMPSNNNTGIVKKEDKALDIESLKIRRISYEGEECFPGDEICRRAENRYEETSTSKNNYRVLSNNCEHFCHYCSVGDVESKQVQSCTKCCRGVTESCVYSLPNVLRILLKILIITTDDYLRNIGMALGVLCGMLAIYCLFVCLANGHIVFCFCCRQEHFCRFKMICCCCKSCKLTETEKKYCRNCHDRKKRIRWLGFTVIATGQLLGNGALVVMILCDVKESIMIGVAVTFSVVTLIVNVCVPRLYDYCPPKCLTDKVDHV